MYMDNAAALQYALERLGRPSIMLVKSMSGR